MTLIPIKTGRETALENDIAIAAPRLQSLRTFLIMDKLDEMDMEKKKLLALRIDWVEEIMAILDIPYHVSQPDPTYRE